MAASTGRAATGARTAETTRLAGGGASAPPPAVLDTPSGLVASAQSGQIDLAWNAVAGATYYRVYRHTSDSFGGASQINSNGATTGTTYSDTTATGTSPWYYWITAVDTVNTLVSSESESANATLPPAGGLGPNAITVGTPVGWPGYRSIGYEIPFTGDGTASSAPYNANGFPTYHPENLESSATARYRVKPSGGAYGSWETALDPWRMEDYEFKQGTAYTGEKLYADNLLWFTEGDTVQVEVTFDHPDGVNGSAVKTFDVVCKTSPPAIGSLTDTYTTRYVRTDGSDSASGANNTTDPTTGAWATVQKAADYCKATSGHKKIVFGAGRFQARNVLFTHNAGVTGSITLQGAAAPTTWSATSSYSQPFGRLSVANNASSRTIFEYGIVTGPTAGDAPTYSNVWQATGSGGQAALVGPRTSVTYDVWWWDPPVASNIQLRSIGYSTTYNGDVEAIPLLEMDQHGTTKYFAWTAPGTSASVLNARRAEWLHTNCAFRSGAWRDATAGSSRIFLVLPSTASSSNPNNLYITFGSDTAFTADLSGTPNLDLVNFRCENIEFRGYEEGATSLAPGSWHHYKYCYTNNCRTGIALDGIKSTQTHPEDILIEYCYMRMGNLRAAPGVAPNGQVPWKLIKGETEAIAAPGANSDVWQARRVAENLEGSGTKGLGGAKRSTVRYCTVDGLFNGFGGSSKDYGRYGASGYEEYGNTAMNCADESFGERGKACFLYRCFENYASHNTTFAEHADGDWGPMVYARNVAWRIGTAEIAQTLTTPLDGDSLGAGPTAFKCSGGNHPQPMVRVANCTIWSNQTNFKIWHKGAGGVGYFPYPWWRNNIFRATKKITTSGDEDGYDEDYCLMAAPGESAAGGTDVGGQSCTTILQYRSNTQYPTVGDHTNEQPLSHVDFDLDDETTLDGLLMDPTNGDLRLKVAQRSTFTGVVIPNLTRWHASGATAPDIGPGVYT